MEDAMALLQTGKRLATAAFRRESICRSEDSFSVSSAITISTTTPPTTLPSDPTDTESVNQLISHIKLLLRFVFLISNAPNNFHM
ncbi:hypothetical protein I3842_12G129200 [Carya illinoinensis]|uniref:Uncharacterized protein n=1 Tax=Carya illinoinensis TaxID=32201 RepID=A0A922DK42_CARIL|nr:hypothetical protein I3842_12G129200 [Carya illinoinensis]